MTRMMAHGRWRACALAMVVACGGKHRAFETLTNGGTAASSGGTAGSAPVDAEGGRPNPTTGGGSDVGGLDVGGATGASADAGTAGGDADAGAGRDAGGAGAAGGAGEEVAQDPYAPRAGTFKVLVYSAAKAYRHDSIEAGEQMLQAMGRERGFEVELARTNERITPAGLAEIELVYFNNTSGDVFNESEQRIYEEWMTNGHGAFAGHHSATNTESGWSFYAEVTGQFFDGW